MVSGRLCVVMLTEIKRHRCLRFRNFTLTDWSGDATRGQAAFPVRLAFRVRNWSASGMSSLTRFPKIVPKGRDASAWKRVLACKSKKNHETKLRHQDENGETSGIRLSSNFEFPYSARGLDRCRRAAEIGTTNEFFPWVGLCDHAR